MSSSTSRTSILAAARRANIAVGPGKATMSAIAAAAGVSRVTLYKWFPTKEELFEAVEAYETELFIAGLTEELARRRSPNQRFDAALRYLFAYLEGEPGWSGAVAHDATFALASMRATLLPHTAVLAEVLGDALTVVPAVRSGAVPADAATELLLRLAYSHYLIPHADADAMVAHVRALLGLPRRRS